MFHLDHRTPDREPSRTKLSLLGRMPSFTWVFVTLCSLVLVFGAASFPALAASGSPTLKVVPKNVGIPGDGIDCKGILSNGTSVCHVTLTETVSSGKSLHWFTRSDFPAMFSQSNGNLKPGQSVKVTITTRFCGGYTNFYFVGPKNVATVTFQCG